jgi:hypothetical protein
MVLRSWPMAGSPQLLCCFPTSWQGNNRAERSVRAALLCTLCTEHPRRSQSTQSTVCIHSLHDEYISRQVFARKTCVQLNQLIQQSLWFTLLLTTCFTTLDTPLHESNPVTHYLTQESLALNNFEHPQNESLKQQHPERYP